MRTNYSGVRILCPPFAVVAAHFLPLIEMQEDNICSWCLCVVYLCTERGR